MKLNIFFSYQIGFLIEVGNNSFETYLTINLPFITFFIWKEKMRSKFLNEEEKRPTEEGE